MLCHGTSFGTSMLNGLHNTKTAPFQDLSQSTNSSPRLTEPDVERPRRSAGSYHDCPLPPMQRFRKPAWTFPHQTINHPIKKYLQRPWHITPITRSTDYPDLTLLYQGQYPLSIVSRENTMQARTTTHTACTGMYGKTGHRFIKYFRSKAFGGFLHGLQHTRYVTPLAGAGIQYQDFHLHLRRTSKRKSLNLPRISTHYYIL